MAMGMFMCGMRGERRYQGGNGHTRCIKDGSPCSSLIDVCGVHAFFSPSVIRVVGSCPSVMLDPVCLVQTRCAGGRLSELSCPPTGGQSSSETCSFGDRSATCVRLDLASGRWALRRAVARPPHVSRTNPMASSDDYPVTHVQVAGRSTGAGPSTARVCPMGAGRWGASRGFRRAAR